MHNKPTDTGQIKYTNKLDIWVIYSVIIYLFHISEVTFQNTGKFLPFQFLAATLSPGLNNFLIKE